MHGFFLIVCICCCLGLIPEASLSPSGWQTGPDHIRPAERLWFKTVSIVVIFLSNSCSMELSQAGYVGGGAEFESQNVDQMSADFLSLTSAVFSVSLGN